MNIKAVMMWLLAGLVVTGCGRTVDKRREDKEAAYSELSPEFRALVDQGRIKVGMPKDAVYIAWGKPSQIIQGESSGGPIETWLYYGTHLREYQYWRSDDYWYRGRYFMAAPYLDYDYYPQYYVRGEATFENGIVKSWKTMPRY